MVCYIFRITVRSAGKDWSRSLRNLEKEVSARKTVNDKEVVVPSKSLNPGDEVIVMQVKQFQEMALLKRGKHS
jgi:high-affinity K+ transport system ATPase subunit B